MQTPSTLGPRPARHLRLADRDAGRLARHHPRHQSGPGHAIGAMLLDLDDPTTVLAVFSTNR